MKEHHIQISAAERRLRKAAVVHAHASVELEGFIIPPAEKEHAQRYVDGLIDLDEYLSAPSRTVRDRQDDMEN
jgi:hypothetical protein